MSVLMGNTIDNSGSFQPSNVRLGAPSERLESTGGHSAQQAPPHTAGGYVRFSDSAALLQRVHSQISAEPTVDEARVQASRQAIESGSFEIGFEQIASKLLEFERELP